MQISEKGAMVRPFPFYRVCQKSVPIAERFFDKHLCRHPFWEHYYNKRHKWQPTRCVPVKKLANM